MTDNAPDTLDPDEEAAFAAWLASRPDVMLAVVESATRVTRLADRRDARRARSPTPKR